MRTSDATQLLPRLTWDDPRVHLLDDIWLLSIFAVLVAVALPWFLSGFAVQVLPVACGLLALGAIHMVFTSLAEPARPAGPWRHRCLSLLHLLGVLVIAFIWQRAGGLQNPAFLTVFALPVIGAIFLSRWQPYLTGLVALVGVLAGAYAEIPELRWYVSGLGPAGAWLAAQFDHPGSSLSVPFAGFYAPAGFFLVVLEVFAVLLLACAVAAEYLGTVFERLYLHVRVAREEAARGQELWAMLIEQLPLPAVLVDTDTLNTVCASELALQRYCAPGATVAGRPVFDSIRLSYPEVVQELIGGEDGLVPQAVIRVGSDIRIAQVQVHHVSQRGRRFALILIEDTTEAFAVKAGLDAAEHAALVLDARGKLLSFNRPAAGLFPGIAAGISAADLITQPASTGPWWHPGVSGRRRMHLEIAPRIYQVTSSAVALSGEEESIYVIAFLPIAKAELADQGAADSTMGTRILGGIR
ncbi:MAG TPA: hypothetical protein VGF89_12315 [Steroidobacteraceae bacterium]|jgi:hypothetical protein